jgi:anti-anti-sigma factor
MAVTPIENDGFEAGGELEEARLCVHLRGHADLDAEDVLDGFVAEVDREASAGAVREVVVDMRDLEFMNSSCLKTLVTWLYNVRRRPTSAQYLIRFLSDRAAFWQERSLATLKAFAPAIVLLD